MERQERVHQILESLAAELKVLLDQWLPLLEELGFLSELGGGNLKILSQVELNRAHVCILGICSGKSLDVLSPREQQIARLVRAGRSDKEISRELRISEDTVGTHLKRCYAKLGIHSRLLLSQYARLLS